MSRFTACSPNATSIEKLSPLSSLGLRVYDAARQHAMESRTKAARELEAESDKSRVAKRARLESTQAEEGTPMDTDSSSARLGGNRLIKRKELIVLMEQALANLGFREVSEQLAEESGVQHETQTVAAFRKAILEGDFGEALRLLDQLGLGERGAAKQARFLILEQKFLESLIGGNVSAALQVLQQDLAGLNIRQERLHTLAGCMLCMTPESLRRHVDWPGTKGHRNREQLLRDIQEIVPPDIMLPEGRLEDLLEQALTQQLSSIDIRMPIQMPVSLLTDYSFSRGHIPTCTTQVLSDHAEEVWHVQFSHNGRWLASASKDATAILWEVTPQRQLVRRHTLRGHTGALTFCCWNPDDTLLATCSLDSLVKLWDVQSGICVRTLDHHQGAATTAAWMPGGAKILTGGEDKWLHLCSINGDEWSSFQSDGINEVLALNDGRVLLTPYGENRVDVWDIERSRDVLGDPLVLEGDCIVSCSASSDSSRLLLNMASRAVHLWTIPKKHSKEEARLLVRFRGAKERQSRFVVRSCFGGYNDSYVLSGSEECKVFVWHTASGELLASLEGHSGTVNSVSWNPKDHHMFASASDDRSIHIWGLDPNSTHRPGSPMAASPNGAGSPARPWRSQ